MMSLSVDISLLQLGEVDKVISVLGTMWGFDTFLHSIWNQKHFRIAWWRDLELCQASGDGKNACAPRVPTAHSQGPDLQDLLCA